MIDSEYLLVLFLWAASPLLLLARAWGGGRPVVGLALAYWVNLALMHLVSGVILLLPWHQSPYHAETIAGFKQTGLALAGLLAGNLLLAPLLVPAPVDRRPLPPPAEGPRRLAVCLIWSGLGCAFLLLPVFGRVPTVNAILSGGMSLAVTGFGLLWWNYWKIGQRAKAWRVLAWALAVPILSLGLHGMMGTGVCALIVTACLVMIYYRPRRTVVLGSLVCLFVGLSLYPTYMKVRLEIRRAVWGGADLGERVDKIALLGSEWEWFDTENTSHLSAIEQRLNQNWLVGRAVQRTTEGKVEYAHGETVANSLLALVPRAFWPDKPAWAGSGGLVSRFTGLKFARGTSVGIGHVMELYVNFGPAGVFVGCLVLGVLLGVADLMCGRHLQTGDWWRFAPWYVGGIALLQAGGNFAELTAGAAGGVILCLFVTQLLAGPLPARPLTLPSPPCVGGEGRVRGVPEALPES